MFKKFIIVYWFASYGVTFSPREVLSPGHFAGSAIFSQAITCLLLQLEKMYVVALDSTDC
jgi:hypothetical protein